MWAGSMSHGFAASAERTEATSRTMNGMQQLQSLMASPAMSSAAAHTVTEEEFDRQADCLVAAAAPEIAAASAAAGPAGVALADIEVAEDEMAKLLQQLHTEPNNDDERATKFLLYEKYAETVSDARKATLDFWAEAVEEFAGNAKAAVENDIRKLDGEQNMGFAFNEGSQRWFVYDMVKAADRNSRTIERLLASMRTKLELLSSQAECPICLEAFSAEQAEGNDDAEARPTAVLGCCHKVCQECWDHWQEINPHNAFCPLCRQQDFLVRIMPDA